MGETVRTSARRSSSGTSACQLATGRRRWARAWRSLSVWVAASRGQLGVTTSSGARSATCACVPRVLATVLACRPSMSAVT